MKLIIDIGNTAVKIALFKDKELVSVGQFSNCTLKNINKFIKGRKISRAIISSVVALNEGVLEVLEVFDALLLDENTPLPIKNNYKTKNTLGKDRLAAVVGATTSYKGKDIVVFDAGTCLTVDFITADKCYVGGRISPGIAMRYKALSEFTNKLPHCKISDKSELIGDDTQSSIISGVQQGILAEVRGVINLYKKQNKDTINVVTGGDCFFFEKALKNSIFANPFLVLEGLNEILDYNE